MGKKKTRDGNHSKKTPNGTVLVTRDKYLSNKESPHEKQHPEKGRAGLYRMVMVLDSNRKEELAIVELTTSKKGKLVSPLSQSRSRARPFIKTKFSDNTPIQKITGKFENKHNDQHNYSGDEAETFRIYSTSDRHVPKLVKKLNKKELRELKVRGSLKNKK
jgi:hypothetical protein